MRSEIRADVVEEGARLAEAARASGTPLRLIGGVAVGLHAGPGGVHPAFVRPYGDIDLVTTRRGGRDSLELLTSLGYAPNERFNAMNAGRRLVLHDVENGRRVDVFVGEFRMCHALPITDRLALDPATVPLAELLLTKLQIVELNAKDVQDIGAILHDHEVGEHDADTVNADYVASLLAGDWGLWRTTRQTLETTARGLAGVALEPEEREGIEKRIERLWARVEAEPKSLRWRNRARLGERAKWYEEPEEIAHG